MNIDQKYMQLGGPSGFLGKPTSAEAFCADLTGRFRHYQNGSIFWSPATDAHEVHGAIHALWTQLGSEQSWLGYPTSDEGPEAGGGRISSFENGNIDWASANGAVDRANLTFQAYHGSTLAQQTQSYHQLKLAGWRIKSLAIYGGSPLYAAVWVLEEGPDWIAFHDATPSDLNAIVQSWSAKNYKVTLIAATGPSSNPIFAGVMELTTGPLSIFYPGLTPDQFRAVPPTNSVPNPPSFYYWAEPNNWYVRSAAVYGNASDPRIAAVYDTNPGETGWNCPAQLTSFDDTQAIFNAQVGHESRLYAMIPSTFSQWLALYRGDSVGPGLASTSLTADGYQTQFNQLTAQGYYPSGLGVAGNTDDEAVFSAIFTKHEAPLPKRWIVTGQPVPSMALFDEQMQGYMRRHSIRNASLAIAKGPILVYARAFTWAEPTYPIATPTNLFRIGSCSKCLTTILIHQLIQENKLSYVDKAVNKLALTPPPGQSIVNADFVNYTIGELLSHQTGIASNFAQADATIVKLFGKQLPLTSKQEIASWLMTQPSIFPVGSKYEYANSNFAVMGAVVEKLRGPEWFTVFQNLVMSPLGLQGMCAVSGSLLSQRAQGEVLYHGYALTLGQSVMSPDRPLVHDAYGNVNLSVGDAIGGVALAPASYVKIMAALDLGKGLSNPLLSTDTVKQMWSYPNSIASAAGWGNGWGGYQTPSGVQVWSMEGALSNCHTVIAHRMDGYSLCAAFNTGQLPGWVLPDWDDLIESVPEWPGQDLFPTLGIPSL